MDQRSRRSFLRSAVAGTGAAAIITSAGAKRPDTHQLRLRRGIDDPISPEEISSKKRQILKEVPEARSGDGAPQREPANIGENEFIVGYNLDIVDGAPSEWVGVYKETPAQLQMNDLSKQQRIPVQKAVDKVHTKANEKASSAKGGKK